MTCCILCIERNKCKSPAWLPRVKAKEVVKEEKMKEVLEELLKKFE